MESTGIGHIGNLLNSLLSSLFSTAASFDIIMEIPILFGSQTGTAEYAANELARLLRKNKIPCQVSSFDTFDITTLPDTAFFIVIVSTTGHGDPPNNMKSFWSFILQRKLPSDALKAVSFALFGLGDSSYVKFNNIGRLLYKRLQQLGAKPIISLGEGDYQSDFEYETEFEPWSEQLIKLISDSYAVGTFNELEPSKSTVVKEGEEIKEISFDGVVVSNEKLTRGDDKVVHKIEIKAFSEVEFKFGDVVCIQPENSKYFVDILLKRLGLTGVEVISLDTDLVIPSGITTRQLLTNYLNIQGSPTRYFCEQISQFAELDIHKEKLELFATKTTVVV